MRSSARISPRRLLPGMVRWRFRLYFTAAASIGVPSWKVTPGRSFITRVLGSVHAQEVASWGTISSFSSRSTSLSHRPANTMRPTKVRASVGVEDVGILVEGDAQRLVWYGLGLGGQGEQHGGGGVEERTHIGPP